MEKEQTIVYTSEQGDEVKIDTTDQNIHEMMKIVVRLLRYMGYDDDTIGKGLQDSMVD